MTSVHGAYGFQLRAPNTPLQPCELPVLDPRPDEVVVEVAGCGVCHTDVGFAFDGVPTRHPLPLILGHEISGRVVAAGENSQELAWAIRDCSRGDSVRVMSGLPSRTGNHLSPAIHARQ